MRKLIVGVVSLIFSATLAVASPQHGKDDHHDRDDHHDHGNPHDRDDHHDNGKHLGWEKHEVSVQDSHHEWDHDHDRGHTVVIYPHGHYVNVRKAYIARSVDFHARRVILEDHSNWVVATGDIGRCHDWQWNRDNVYVYEDDIHPGLYLLFNARLGSSVHVTFFGTP